MNKSIFKILILLLISCSAEKGTHFENLNYQQTLAKAQKLNMPIIVDVFSDG